jgi:hypothetical protein
MRRIKEGMIIMVRAKFRCVNIDGNNAQFDVVIDGSEENKKFFKYTPGGHINILVDNENAKKQFEVGKEYYVDFTPAE